MPLDPNAKKKKLFIFGSIFVSSLGASLLVTSFATDYWFVSDARVLPEANLTGSGNVNFGLFRGRNELSSTNRLHSLHVVCLGSSCMYSCADSKETRENQLQMLLGGETQGLKEDCQRETPSLMMVYRKLGQVERSVDARQADVPIQYVGPEYLEEATETTTEETPTTHLEFMDFGLWVGTIACLSAGLLMAVVGALFAVVNTATTPVEAITGVPGLYLWNGLAALFDMLTVILWAVQFHKHLSSNVLLYDANDGWTTEGLEVFGYSFWLVVVAIFVHVANIAIIAIGTYEPKKKTQLEAPDSKGGNIMLY